MAPFVDVELADPETSRVISRQKGGPPQCSPSSSNSKRKSRPNVRRSLSMRKRNFRAAGATFSQACRPVTVRTLISGDQALSVKRAFRSARRFAPLTGRAVFLGYFIGQFLATMKDEWTGVGSEVDSWFAFAAIVTAIFFALSSSKAFCGLCAFFMYRCMRVPGDFLLNCMNVVFLSTVQVLGLCRARAHAARGLKDVHTLQSSRADVIVLLARFSLALIVVDHSVNIFEESDHHFLGTCSLALLPVAAQLVFGYCFHQAASIAIVFICLVSTSTLIEVSPTPTLGLGALDCLPSIAACTLMLATDGGAFSVDRAFKRREQLVF